MPGRWLTVTASAPGSSIAGLRGSRIGSDLHWSPDGSWLVWDHRDGWEPGAADDGYYAHSMTSSDTRLLTGPASRNLLSFVGWLPQGNVLQ